jgi:hypothetical protein
MTSLTLALLLAGPPQLDPVPIDLATAPLAVLRAVDGRRVIAVVSLPWPALLAVQATQGFDVYPHDAPDDTDRGVWLPAGADTRGLDSVVGRLEVIDHPARRGLDNEVLFEAFTEVRVVAER